MGLRSGQDERPRGYEFASVAGWQARVVRLSRVLHGRLHRTGAHLLNAIRALSERSAGMQICGAPDSNQAQQMSCQRWACSASCRVDRTDATTCLQQRDANAVRVEAVRIIQPPQDR